MRADLIAKLRENAAFLERKGWSKSAILEMTAATALEKLESPGEPSVEREALHRIKELVCGEARPRWDNSPETTSTRGVIADICDIGLNARRAPEPGAGQWLAIDTAKFMNRPPCYICGYNGPGYYDSVKHPCAAHYHAAVDRRASTKGEKP